LLLGRELGPKRDQVTLATKCGPLDDPSDSLEESLRRLQTDYVDLLQLHEVGPDFEGSLEKLDRLRREGKARAIGLCNASASQLVKAHEMVALDTYQAPYNLFDREAEQRHIPFCRKHGLDFLAYRPLASGMLTTRFASASPPTFPEGDHRRMIWWFKGQELSRRLEVIERLSKLAADQAMTLSAFSLKWVLSRPGMAVVLAGARTPEQLEENLSARDGLLDPERVSAVDEAVFQVFRPALAMEHALAEAAGWEPRERFIVEHLDGLTSCDSIAAEWSDGSEPALMGAQVRQFVDQLQAAGMVEFR